MGGHYPEPMEFDADLMELTCQGALIAQVLTSDDFPCLDPEEVDFEEVDQQCRLTGQRLAASYNACRGVSTDALECDAVKDLLAACKTLWENRDAQQTDQAACRRLYNAWKDMGKALALIRESQPAQT